MAEVTQSHLNLNDLLVVDYETAIILPDGSTQASTEFYRNDFRILSCAFTECTANGYRSWFLSGEDAIKAELAKHQNRRLIAHNVPFELGCSICRFPDLNLNWYADTMRLAQNYDNGGNDEAFERLVIDDIEDPDAEPEEQINYIGGFSLVNCAKRILNRENHKKEAHEWLLANVEGVNKRNAGQFLDRLPPEILERYNVGDTEATMELFLFITDFFSKQGFDWTIDHSLYLSTVGRIVRSKINGVRIDREKAYEAGKAVCADITKIEQDFIAAFKEPIAKVEREKLLAEIRARKTLKGRKKYLKRIRAEPERWKDDISFNVGSNKQLEQLFIGQMRMQPQFLTEKGSPSFRSVVLHQWGEGGLMLAARRKHLIVLKQICNLLKLSEYDGHWHLDLKAAGTSTGRFAGGSQQ